MHARILGPLQTSVNTHPHALNRYAARMVAGTKQGA